MKITDFKTYQDYCNYLISNYGITYQKNRSIEANGLLKEKSINCNGEPWASFTKEEFFAIKFYDFCEKNRQKLELQYQKDLTFSELLHELKNYEK